MCLSIITPRGNITFFSLLHLIYHSILDSIVYSRCYIALYCLLRENFLAAKIFFYELVHDYTTNCKK
nr:hypothetical protein Itr_chr07CG06380 [Ipomoea trifida]